MSSRPASLYVISLLAAATLLVSGCNGSNGSAAGKSVKVGVINPKAIFVAKAAVGASKIKQHLQNDSITDLRFYDDQGKEVDIQVVQLLPLNSEYFAVAFLENGWMRKLIVRIADGETFDLSNYDLATSQLKENYVFAWHIAPGRSSILHRIDLETLSATPLMNPATLDGDHWLVHFMVDADNDVQFVNNINRTYLHTLFFDNTNPLSIPTGPATVKGAECPNGGGGTSLGTMYGEDGQIYLFCTDDVPDHNNDRQINTFIRIANFTRSGTQFTDGPTIRTVQCTNGTGNPVCPDDSPIITKGDYSLNDRDRYVLTSTGYYHLTPIAGAGMQAEFTARPMSAIPISYKYNNYSPRYSEARISGDAVYWNDGYTLKRLKLTSTSTVETLVTVPWLINFKIIGGTIYYISNPNGQGEKTFKIREPGETPELVMEGAMEFGDHIEFQQ